MVNRQSAPRRYPLPVSAHRPRRVIANPAPVTPEDEHECITRGRQVTGFPAVTWPTCRPPFTGPRGGRIGTAVLRDATHWDDVVIGLGYEHLRRHDLRHTGLTWMADAGVPVHVLRKIAGHGSLTTTQRYLHPDERSITEAGDALTAHLGVRRSPSGPQLRVV